MILAIDFDGTLVEQDHAYDDLVSPLVWKPGAKEAVLQLDAAGHILLLWSARCNRSLLYSPEWDPLVRAGVRKIHPARWAQARDLQWARYQQMLDFLDREVPEVFVVDDGMQGKPCADLFIDDRALTYASTGTGWSWPMLAQTYGQPPLAPARLPGLNVGIDSG